jgi:hypothetical protein
MANTAVKLLTFSNPSSAQNQLFRSWRWVVQRWWQNYTSRFPGDHVVPRNRFFLVGGDSFADGDKKGLFKGYFLGHQPNATMTATIFTYRFFLGLYWGFRSPPIINKFFNWKNNAPVDMTCLQLLHMWMTGADFLNMYWRQVPSKATKLPPTFSTVF